MNKKIKFIANAFNYDFNKLLILLDINEKEYEQILEEKKKLTDRQLFLLEDKFEVSKEYLLNDVIINDNDKKLNNYIIKAEKQSERFDYRNKLLKQYGNEYEELIDFYMYTDLYELRKIENALKIHNIYREYCKDSDMEEMDHDFLSFIISFVKYGVEDYFKDCLKYFDGIFGIDESVGPTLKFCCENGYFNELEHLNKIFYENEYLGCELFNYVKEFKVIKYIVNNYKMVYGSLYVFEDTKQLSRIADRYIHTNNCHENNIIDFGKHRLTIYTYEKEKDSEGYVREVPKHRVGHFCTAEEYIGLTNKYGDDALIEYGSPTEALNKLLDTNKYDEMIYLIEERNASIENPKILKILFLDYLKRQKK